MAKRVIILLLVPVNAVLITWYLIGNQEGTGDREQTGMPPFEKEVLKETVSGVLRAHGIEKFAVRERTVPPGVRTELRIGVPAGVSLTTINFEIHRAARALGYKVSAREDSRTGRVSIHIRGRDAIVMTLIFYKQQ